MGVVQREAMTTTIASYLGLIVGYLNKGVLFVIFFSTEQVGLLNLLVSVGVLFGHLANIGILNTIWKFFPFFRNEKLGHYGFLRTILRTILISCVVFSGLVILFEEQISAFYASKSELFVVYFLWVVPIGVMYVLYLVIDMYLRGLQKNTVSVLSMELIHRLVITTLLLLFCKKMISFHLLVVLFSLSYIVPTAIVLVYLSRIKELSFKRNPNRIPKRFRKILVNYSVFNYFNSIGYMTVITMDAMMIASFLGLDETGIYTTIIYLISAMQVPNRSILRVASVLVAQFWKERNMVKMNELYKKTSSISLIVAMYMLVVVWGNLDVIFSFLPKAYETGSLVFLLLMIGKMIDVYFGLNGTIFITSKKYRYDIIFTGVLLVLILVMNLFLIPRLGLVGAAISTSLALLLYNLARLIAVWIWYKMHPFEWSQLYITLISAAIIVATQFIPSNYVSSKYLLLLINSGAISLVFFGLIIGLKLNDELNNFYNKWKPGFLKR